MLGEKQREQKGKKRRKKKAFAFLNEDPKRSIAKDLKEFLKHALTQTNWISQREKKKLSLELDWTLECRNKITLS